MKIHPRIPFCAAFLALASSCPAVLITLDPLSTNTNVFGTWDQERTGSDSGIWFLRGGVILEIGFSREGNFPDPNSADIGNGRWAGASCQLTRTYASVGGYSDGLFFNYADKLGDDSQFLVKPGTDDMIHTFSFQGTYSPTTDEWSGSFGAMVSPANPVPDGGCSILLFCAALAGIHGLNLRFA